MTPNIIKIVVVMITEIVIEIINVILHLKEIDKMIKTEIEGETLTGNLVQLQVIIGIGNLHPRMAEKGHDRNLRLEGPGKQVNQSTVIKCKLKLHKEINKAFLFPNSLFFS